MNTLLVGVADLGMIVRGMRVSVAVGVSLGTVEAVAEGVSVGVVVGVNVMMGIDVAVATSTVEAGGGVGVMRATNCKVSPAATLACQPAGKVAC